MPGDDPPVVHVCVGPDRTFRRMAGVVVHRTAHLATRVDWRRRPPRMRPEHATIDVVESRIRSGDVAGANAALTRACHTREVGPPTLRSALAHRMRVSRRALIAGMIDIATILQRRGWDGVLQRCPRCP